MFPPEFDLCWPFYIQVLIPIKQRDLNLLEEKADLCPTQDIFFSGIYKGNIRASALCCPRPGKLPKLPGSASPCRLIKACELTFAEFRNP